MTDFSKNNNKGPLPLILLGSVVVVSLLQISGFRHTTSDMLLDIIQRQYILRSRYRSILKAVTYCSPALSILEPKAVIHCSLGIIQHNDTLGTFVASTHLHQTLVSSQRTYWTLIVPSYLWTECPQQSVKICDNH